MVVAGVLQAAAPVVAAERGPVVLVAPVALQAAVVPTVPVPRPVAVVDGVPVEEIIHTPANMVVVEAEQSVSMVIP